MRGTCIAAAMTEAIKVAVRVRPFNARERELGSQSVVSMSEQTTTVAPLVGPPKVFTYDYSYWSFDKSSPSFVSQEVIYAEIGQAILDSAVDGYNGCLFAYGQTGSGKSYSMIGYGEPGVIPRTVEALFERKTRIEGPKGDGELRVWISFIEIYCERLRDLLQPGVDVGDNLKVMDHPDFGVYIPSLVESPCKEMGHVQKLMDFGIKKRVTSATNMNSVSSRSHSVFVLKLQRFFGQPPVEGQKDVRKAFTAKINLIDLAGSERVSKTGAEGRALHEGCSINQSLSALGLVIKELSIRSAPRAGPKKDMPPAAKNVVPFRSSKLTFLLRDSLAGNSKTFMLAAISPSAGEIEETMSTLRFASSVKKIKTVAKQNIDKKDEAILGLQSEIKKLKARITRAVSPSTGLEVELQGEIEERERLLQVARQSYEHQIQEAAELEGLRDEVLKAHGLTGAQIEEGLGVESLPYLLNMSDDPALTGALMYILKVGVPLTIGSGPQNVAVLSGLGIPETLCAIENTGQDVLVSLPAAQKARVRVNGSLVRAGPTKLQHFDKVVFGRAYALRLVDPQHVSSDHGAASVAQALHEEDMLRMLIPEESEAWGELRLYFDDLWSRLGEERGAIFFTCLSEASHLVDEANEITNEMRPGDQMKFEVELVWDIHRKASDIIVIRAMQFQEDNSESTVVCYWTLSRFRERLEIMRDCYDTFHRKGDWPGYGDPLEDPWMDPSSVELALRMHTHVEEEFRKAIDKSQVVVATAAVSGGKTIGSPQASLRNSASTSRVGPSDSRERRASGRQSSPLRSRTTSPLRARAGGVGAAPLADSSEAPTPVPQRQHPQQDEEEIGRLDRCAAQDALLSTLREQLREKEEREAAHREQAARLERTLGELERQHGPLAELLASGAAAEQAAALLFADVPRRLSVSRPLSPARSSRGCAVSKFGEPLIHVRSMLPTSARSTVPTPLLKFSARQA